MLTVKELSHDEIDVLTDYWMNADKDYLLGMGVDLTKLPAREDFKAMLEEQLRATYADKKAYALIWLLNGVPAGHSNINKIKFGEEAYKHLHIWNAADRNKGYGIKWLKQSIPYYFKNFGLQHLFCEPYALNPAPNHTMQKLGFEFVDEYITTPGWINFEQPVKLWKLSKDIFEKW